MLLEYVHMHPDARVFRNNQNVFLCEASVFNGVEGYLRSVLEPLGVQVSV